MRQHAYTSRATRWSWLLGLLLSVACIPAWSTSSFGYDAEPFEVQFVGHQANPVFGGVIEVGMSQGPRSLPPGSYRLTSYIYGKSLRLAFVNKGDPTLPPSFVLSVSGRKATLKTGGKTFNSVFRWTDAGE